MLTDEMNRMLTEVGPGKPMGELLRRYWQPIAGVSEFDKVAIKPLRLFGEDLVLYKDMSGTYGLVQRRCPHRNADLSYGYVEECGIRCSYHGWQFDQSGQCVHQPFEEAVDPSARMRKNVRAKAYLVQEKAGLLFAYMGPLPAPLLPDWDAFNYKNGFAQAAFCEVPCNWFQCQENSIDPVHFEWAHNNWSNRQQGGDASSYVPTHVKIEFDEFKYGMIYRRLRAGDPEAEPMWTIGRAMLWPNVFYLGHHFEWRVPIDDHNTLNVVWVFSRVPKEREPYEQGRIPSWRAAITDSETGQMITTHILNQDLVQWIGQGVITDRGNERLGASDKGIVMMRRRMLEQMRTVAAGGDPLGIIRDPAENNNIILPSVMRKEMIEGLPRAEHAKHIHLGHLLYDFSIQAGQPEEVRLAYEDAIGEKTRRDSFFKVHGAGDEKKTNNPPRLSVVDDARRA